jgi:hypothetical protein
MRHFLAIVGVLTGLWLVAEALSGVHLYTTQGDLCTRSISPTGTKGGYAQAAASCVRYGVVYRSLVVEMIVGAMLIGTSTKWLIRRFQSMRAQAPVA